MNKAKIFIFAMFFSLVFSLNAQDIKFGWDIGNVKFYYDALHRKYNVNFELIHFNWLFYNMFSAGFNVMEVNNYDENVDLRFLILPLEIAFVPMSLGNMFYLSIYGKAAWQLTQYENDNEITNEFYGSGGIKLSFFPEFAFGYSPYFSLFLEYDTYERLKIGFAIDLSALIIFILHLCD